MKDTRAFLTAGFRSRVTGYISSSDDYWYRVRLYEFRLSEIDKAVKAHHLTWCSDEYPMIEILDWEGRNTLACFKFTNFIDLDKRLEKLSR